MSQLSHHKVWNLFFWVFRFYHLLMRFLMHIVFPSQLTVFVVDKIFMNSIYYFTDGKIVVEKSCKEVWMNFYGLVMVLVLSYLWIDVSQILCNADYKNIQNIFNGCFKFVTLMYRIHYIHFLLVVVIPFMQNILPKKK